MKITNGYLEPGPSSGCQPLIHTGKGTAMGSLAEFAEGSSQFAINSGSTLVDFTTGLPSLALLIADLVGFGTSVDLTASVA